MSEKQTSPEYSAAYCRELERHYAMVCRWVKWLRIIMWGEAVAIVGLTGALIHVR